MVLYFRLLKNFPQFVVIHRVKDFGVVNEAEVDISLLDDAFELWCWRRLLRVPQTARRSNPSILKEISPEYTLEGLMLGHLMRRTDSLEKTLLLGKIEGGR